MEELQAKRERIIDQLKVLARLKNKKHDPESAAYYAQVLSAYPEEMVRAGIMRHAADPDPFIPPVGAIIGMIASVLMDTEGARSPILPPGEAWKIARSTIAAYHPQTRPNPSAQDPAIDRALRQIGGVSGSRWEDAIGEGTIRRAFLKAYDDAIRLPEHISWAIRTGGRKAVIPGKEVPLNERARFSDEAAARAMDLPRWLETGIDDTRAVVLDGSPPPRSLLPAHAHAPVSPERRAALAEDVKRSLVALAARMRIPAEPRLTTEEGQIEHLMDHFRLQPYLDAEQRLIGLRALEEPGFVPETRERRLAPPPPPQRERRGG